MKDLGETNHILGIKLLCDRQGRMLGLSLATTYIDQILARFSMQNFKKRFVPFIVRKSQLGNLAKKKVSIR